MKKYIVISSILLILTSCSLLQKETDTTNIKERETNLSFPKITEVKIDSVLPKNDIVENVNLEQLEEKNKKYLSSLQEKLKSQYLVSQITTQDRIKYSQSKVNYISEIYWNRILPNTPYVEQEIFYNSTLTSNLDLYNKKIQEYKDLGISKMTEKEKIEYEKYKWDWEKVIGELKDFINTIWKTYLSLAVTTPINQLFLEVNPELITKEDDVLLIDKKKVEWLVEMPTSTTYKFEDNKVKLRTYRLYYIEENWVKYYISMSLKNSLDLLLEKNKDTKFIVKKLDTSFWVILWIKSNDISIYSDWINLYKKYLLLEKISSYSNFLDIYRDIYSNWQLLDTFFDNLKKKETDLLGSKFKDSKVIFSQYKLDEKSTYIDYSTYFLSLYSTLSSELKVDLDKLFIKEKNSFWNQEENKKEVE